MKNKEKNFVSVIIYVHNAEEQVERFIKMIINLFENNFEMFEIICVNDACSDRSMEIIKKVAENTVKTTMSILNMSYFHGVEMAMNAGIDLSIGDFVFEFDNTRLDFLGEDIMLVYRKCLEGFDIVSASPDKKNRISSKLFYKIYEKYSNGNYKMTTESFRILSRRVINRIMNMNKTVPYRKAIYANCGLKTAHIKYKIQKIISYDKDKKEKLYRKSLAVDTLILFTDVGYRFAKTMTIIMMLLAIFMISYSIIVYFVSTPVAGWTTIILFLSIGFFGVFGVLTIIIKYLQVIVDLVFKRKHYSFESIEKLTK